MAKRKSTRKAAPKVRLTLEKHFTCLFCNHEKAVECKLNRDQRVGTLLCRVCGVQWRTHIHSLSEPIDVYSDWIDACEAAAVERVNDGNPLPETYQLEDEDYRQPSSSSRDDRRPASNSRREEDEYSEQAVSEDEESVDEDEAEDMRDFIAKDDEPVVVGEEDESSEDISDEDEESEDNEEGRLPEASKPKRKLQRKSAVDNNDRTSDDEDGRTEEEKDGESDEETTAVKRRRLTRIEDFD